MIETPRLRLTPVPLDRLRAEVRQPDRLAAIIHMDAPTEWPPSFYTHDPIEYMLRRLEIAPDENAWWLYAFLLREPAASEPLIGAGGFKGPPTRAGTVEIGYAIVPECRSQGLATEAAAGLIRFAFEHADVQRVIAETLPSHDASIRVLEKCRFRFIGEGSETGVVRFELRRKDWVPPQTTTMSHRTEA